MAKTASVAGMKIVPSGFRVITLPNGQAALQKVKRSRRRFKMSKAQRQKASAAAKKIKIPVITLAALSPTFFEAVDKTQNVSGFSAKLGLAGRIYLKNYLGVKITSSGATSFEPMEMLKGTVPLIGLAMWHRFGLGRRPNRLLGKLKAPLLLS